MLRRRGGLSAANAQAAIASWRSFDIMFQPTTEAVLQSGLAIATHYGFQTFASIILAAAAEAGCERLLRA